MATSNKNSEADRVDFPKDIKEEINAHNSDIQMHQQRLNNSTIARDYLVKGFAHGRGLNIEEWTIGREGLVRRDDKRIASAAPPPQIGNEAPPAAGHNE